MRCAKLNRNRAAMARRRLQPPRPPTASLSGPTSAFSPFASISWQATSRPCKKPVSHLRLNTTAHSYLPTPRGPPVERENCGSGGTTSDGRVVHRQDEEPLIQPKVPLQYMYCGLTDIMCVGRCFDGQTGRQRRRTSCVHASEVVVSFHRTEQNAPISGSLTGVLRARLEQDFAQ